MKQDEGLGIKKSPFKHFAIDELGKAIIMFALDELGKAAHHKTG